MPRCRPGLGPVYHGSPRYDHGSPGCGHGSPRSVGTAFGFNLCFPSRRCNSNWLVSKCAWNKINIRDYLKLYHESIVYVFSIFIVYRLSE